MIRLSAPATIALSAEGETIAVGARCTVAYDSTIAKVVSIHPDGEYVFVEHADGGREGIEAYHIHLV